jgi:hypothetical protein
MNRIPRFEEIKGESSEMEMVDLRREWKRRWFIEKYPAVWARVKSATTQEEMAKLIGEIYEEFIKLDETQETQEIETEEKYYPDASDVLFWLIEDAKGVFREFCWDDEWKKLFTRGTWRSGQE